MAACPERRESKPRLLRSQSVSDSACRDGRVSPSSAVPGSLSGSILYPATDFIVSTANQASDVSTSLPISRESLNSMREKLLTHDKIFMKMLGNSKDTTAVKSSLQDLFIAYQTAFNTLVAGYAQVASLLVAGDSCRSTIIKTCAGISRTCVATVQEAATKIAQSQPIQSSFASAVKSTSKIRIPRGPTVALSDSSTTFIVAPTPTASSKFVDSNSTKSALYKALNPADVDLKVDRITRAGGNEVRVVARSVDLVRLRSSESLALAGLQVKEDSKLNPRILVSGIPKDMTEERIRHGLVHQNLDGADLPDVKVVYKYSSTDSSPFTKCVVEVPPEVRTRLMSVSRIYLGYSSCAFKDHIWLKHCYRCLTFGHIARECKGTEHCGHCSLNHETKNCPNRKTEPCCHNCRTSKYADAAHTAFDGSKCPILKKRLKDRVHMTNYG